MTCVASAAGSAAQVFAFQVSGTVSNVTAVSMSNVSLTHSVAARSTAYSVGLFCTGALRFFASGSLADEPLAELVLRRYLEAALLTACGLALRSFD